MQRRAVIREIQFHLLSSDDIITNSVIDLTHLLERRKKDREGKMAKKEAPMQSPLMGPTTNNPNEVCITCELPSTQCPGHFGHVSLNHPLFHPLFEKEILKLLKVVCFSCYRYLRLDSFGNLVPFEKLVKWTDKKTLCLYCGKRQPLWAISKTGISITMSFEPSTAVECYPKDIRIMLQNFNKKDLEKAGITPWPENLVLLALPVLPPCARPSLVMDDKSYDDHLTIQYAEIIKVNSSIDPQKSVLDQIKEIKALYFKVSTLMDNSKGKSRYSTTGKVIKGIKERISGKNGVPRNNLMGKRVDHSGRTVIGAAPRLRVDQVAVPEKMAEVLSVPVRVSHYNYDQIVRWSHEGGIIIRVRKSDDRVFRFEYAKDLIIEIGDIVERKLQDNDFVLINRQPTLHSGSMMALRAVVSPEKTLRFNLSNTKTFNADFDGDEMNIHVPQSLDAMAELEILSSVENHLLSQRNGQANITLVQDNVVALYLMTVEDEYELSRPYFWDLTLNLVNVDGEPWELVDIIGRIDRIRALGVPPQTGRGIISLCLPGDFFYETDEVCIREGVVQKGTFNKDLIARILPLIFHTHGARVEMMVLNNLQFLSNAWLDHRGFSIGLEDCFLQDPEIHKEISRVVTRCFVEADMIQEYIKIEKIREIQVQNALNKARDVGLKITKEGFRAGNNFRHTLLSGSKGDFFNITQIAGLLGQQYLNGERIALSLNHGRRALPHYKFDEPNLYEARGFITRSFLQGQYPRQALAHSRVGRSGVVDTAMGTSDTGYMQRRIIKLMEDIHIANDYTVRDDVNTVYQFYYGEGLDVTHKPAIDPFLSSLVSKLNHRYEKY